MDINNILANLSNTQLSSIKQLIQSTDRLIIGYNRSMLPNKHTERVMQILATDDMLCAKKIVYLIKKGYTKEPNCPECCKTIPNYWAEVNHRVFCCSACYHKNDEARKKISSIKKDLYAIPEIKADIEKKKTSTTMKNFGVMYPMQNPESFEKQKKSSFQTHEVDGMMLQGYEPRAYRFLKMMYDEVIQGSAFLKLKDLKLTWIDSTNKMRFTYPDFFVPSISSFVEVKGSYTREIDDEKIMKTKESLMKLGFGYYVLTIHPNKYISIESLHIQKEGVC